MDGVIYRGNKLIPGANQFIAELRARRIPFLFLTNNSQRTRLDVATRLHRMGIEASEENIFTCAMATARFLARQKPAGTAYVIGEGGLLQALHEEGYAIVDHDPDYVVVGEGRAFTMEMIETGVRMIEFECRIDDYFVNRFRADGVIIATPTGSTAYSLSAGGPIVHPNLSAILMAPICPHMLSNRPVIVPGDSVVEISFRRESDELRLTIDGQIAVPLEPRDQIVMLRSQTAFRMLRPLNRDYFEVLRTKLKWGTM